MQTNINMKNHHQASSPVLKLLLAGEDGWAGRDVLERRVVDGLGEERVAIYH
jgi:hypothetical protein